MTHEELGEPFLSRGASSWRGWPWVMEQQQRLETGEEMCPIINVEGEADIVQQPSVRHSTTPAPCDGNPLTSRTSALPACPHRRLLFSATVDGVRRLTTEETWKTENRLTELVDQLWASDASVAKYTQRTVRMGDLSRPMSIAAEPCSNPVVDITIQVLLQTGLAEEVCQVPTPMAWDLTSRPIVRLKILHRFAEQSWFYAAAMIFVTGVLVARHFMKGTPQYPLFTLAWMPVACLFFGALGTRLYVGPTRHLFGCFEFAFLELNCAVWQFYCAADEIAEYNYGLISIVADIAERVPWFLALSALTLMDAWVATRGSKLICMSVCLVYLGSQFVHAHKPPPDRPFCVTLPHFISHGDPTCTNLTTMGFASLFQIAIFLLKYFFFVVSNYFSKMYNPGESLIIAFRARRQVAYSRDDDRTVLRITVVAPEWVGSSGRDDLAKAMVSCVTDAFAASTTDKDVDVEDPASSSSEDEYHGEGEERTPPLQSGRASPVPALSLGGLRKESLGGCASSVASRRGTVGSTPAVTVGSTPTTTVSNTARMWRHRSRTTTGRGVVQVILLEQGRRPSNAEPLRSRAITTDAMVPRSARVSQSFGMGDDPTVPCPDLHRFLAVPHVPFRYISDQPLVTFPRSLQRTVESGLFIPILILLVAGLFGSQPMLLAHPLYNTVLMSIAAVLVPLLLLAAGGLAGRGEVRLLLTHFEYWFVLWQTVQSGCCRFYVEAYLMDPNVISTDEKRYVHLMECALRMWVQILVLSVDSWRLSRRVKVAALGLSVPVGVIRLLYRVLRPWPTDDFCYYPYCTDISALADSSEFTFWAFSFRFLAKLLLMKEEEYYVLLRFRALRDDL